MTSQLTDKMALLEARRGKPIREILVEQYAATPTVEGTANGLGISRVSLWAWVKMLGLTWDDIRRDANNGKDGQ